MSVSDDERWMRAALDVVTSRGDDPSTAPIGCVIVLKSKIIGSARNECETMHDATAHAEMVAFRQKGGPAQGWRVARRA